MQRQFYFFPTMFSWQDNNTLPLRSSDKVLVCTSLCLCTLASSKDVIKTEEMSLISDNDFIVVSVGLCCDVEPFRKQHG